MQTTAALDLVNHKSQCIKASNFLIHCSILMTRCLFGFKGGFKASSGPFYSGRIDNSVWHEAGTATSCKEIFISLKHCRRLSALILHPGIRSKEGLSDPWQELPDPGRSHCFWTDLSIIQGLKGFLQALFTLRKTNQPNPPGFCPHSSLGKARKALISGVCGFRAFISVSKFSLCFSFVFPVSWL